MTINYSYIIDIDDTLDIELYLDMNVFRVTAALATAPFL